MYVCMYVYIYIYIHMRIYIYIYIICVLGVSSWCGVNTRTHDQQFTQTRPTQE